jgi:tape measure domain-containing protein
MGISGDSLLFRIKSKNETQKDFADIKGDIRETGSAAEKLGGGFNSASRSTSDFISSLSANVVSTFTSALVSGAKAVLDYSSRMEQTKIAFTSLIGNAGLATKHLEELKKFAIDTPFEFEGLAKVSQRLQGANVELTKVIPLMKDIGNVVAATGEISEERLSGITNAIAQMIGKSKVSAEEMEQLSERGVQGWNILAQATGKTEKELRKLAEQGGISADVMVKALQKVSREKWGDAMEKQSKTFAGAMSSIKDIVMQSAAKMFEPMYAEISKFANNTSKALLAQQKTTKSEFQKFGFSLGEAFGIALADGYRATKGNMIQALIDLNPTTLFLRFLMQANEGSNKGFFKQPDPVVPKANTYVNPYRDSPNRANDEKVALEQTTEMLKKQQEERAKAMEKNIANMQNLNKEYIESARLSYETASTENLRLLESGAKSFEDYKKKALEDLDAFAQTVGTMMRRAYDLSIVGKSGTEADIAKQSFENESKKFTAEINTQLTAIQKQQNEAKKKADEERIKLAERNAARELAVNKNLAEQSLIKLDDLHNKKIIKEDLYQKGIAVIKLQELEREKAINEELLKSLDKGTEKYQETLTRIVELGTAVKRQMVENARSVKEAIDEMTRAGENSDSIFNRSRAPGAAGEEGSEPGNQGTETPGIFDGWTESWRRFREEIEASGGIGEFISGIADLAINAMQNMAGAIGGAIESWALYGDSIGKALRKALAAELAHIAGVATVKALYATALGFLRLAELDFVGAGNAFLSAGLWAALAAGSAIAARAIAPKNAAQSSFNSQTNSATGRNSTSTVGGDASTIDIGRNTPSSANGILGRVVLEVRSNDSHIAEVIENDFGRNGKLRGLFLDAAAA